MAKALNTQDCYALMNELVAQATGQKTLAVVDTSSFVSAGETVLATGVENTLNALSLVLGRTIIAVRPYKAKLSTIQALNTGEYSHRLRKISYFSRKAIPAGDFNTQLYPENLYQGKTNAQDTTSGHESTKSMWAQNQPQPFEMNFCSSCAWDESTTVYEYQIKPAFRDPAVFAEFVAGIMTEKANDIESEKEAFNRISILNKIGDVVQTGTSAQVVNLTAEFNDTFGTNYTSAQLRSTYLKDFLKFFVARFKLTSDRMTERSAAYHRAITRTVKNPETGVDETLYLLRHTPKADQHALLYNPLFVNAEAQVLPEIFNPQYLNIENFEPVDYWQSNYSEEVRPKVNIVPAIYDSSTGYQVQGEQVELDYVVGMLFDRQAIYTMFELETAATTPLEARRMYRNIIWHFNKGCINDPSENCVLFIMADPAEGSNLVGSAVVGTAEAGD